MLELELTSTSKLIVSGAGMESQPCSRSGRSLVKRKGKKEKKGRKMPAEKEGPGWTSWRLETGFESIARELVELITEVQTKVQGLRRDGSLD